MTRALYRKYRPKTLDEVVGQEQVTKPLLLALKQNKLSHAYLFVGPRGCGKTSVARILAHAVNDFDYEIEDDYIDIVEIDGASNRGIDNIRELREKAAIAPTKGKFKIYIIDEVHMLTKEAFNALLKTLEEPPAHVIFIMATTDAYKIPATIISRAQTYNFNLADQKTIADFLKSISSQEKIKIDAAAIQVIAKCSGGSFRDALSLLDQISTLSNEQITEDLVLKTLGLPQDEKIGELLDGYLENDLVRVVDSIKAVLASGIKAETLAGEMIAKILENPQSKLLPLLAKLPSVKAPFAEAKLVVALTMPMAETNSLVPGPALIKKAGPIKNTPTQKPTTLPKPTTPAQKEENIDDAKINFDWDKFLEKVRGLNEAVYLQLGKTSHQIHGDNLEIYPSKRVVKTILSREKNKQILMAATDEKVKIIIRDVDELPSEKPDDLISQISDIMGGKVQNDGGDNPF